MFYLWKALGSIGKECAKKSLLASEMHEGEIDRIYTKFNIKLQTGMSYRPVLLKLNVL
jgi:hypothetical protein